MEDFNRNKLRKDTLEVYKKYFKKNTNTLTRHLDKWLFKIIKEAIDNTLDVVENSYLKKKARVGK